MQVFLTQWFIESQNHESFSSGLKAGQVHGTNVDVGLASYVADAADKSGPIEMIAEEEISAGGHDIHPKIIDLDDVGLTVSNRARYRSGFHISIDLQRQQVGLILAYCLFFFADLQTVLSGDETNVDQVDSFLACLLE